MEGPASDVQLSPSRDDSCQQRQRDDKSSTEDRSEEQQQQQQHDDDGETISVAVSEQTDSPGTRINLSRPKSDEKIFPKESVPARTKLDFLSSSDPDVKRAAMKAIATALNFKKMTLEDLKTHDGVASDTIYIAAAGAVFDVSSATDFYGEGAGYSLFAGHDATVNLARSSLKPKTLNVAASDVGLTADDLECLQSWVARYAKKYPIVGHVDINLGALELDPVISRMDESDGAGECLVC